MAENSAIEWCDATFNPWWGCQRVSPGCQHCYAETLAKRYGHAVWGPATTTERRMMSDDYWKQPVRWNKQAATQGVRRRVFCASMADVFESHPDVIEARLRLWSLIDSTPWLDWLLLTKRPENIQGYLPAQWLRRAMPDNVWLGTTVEDQRRANERIPLLLKVPARVRFLSCEPLLGPVDLTEWIGGWAAADQVSFPKRHTIDWVICGGESGHGARPMHPDWARSLRDQCEAVGTAFFFKQWGEYAPGWSDTIRAQTKGRLLMSADGVIAPLVAANLEATREFCARAVAPTTILYRVGKKAAGRSLDGCEWNELPRGL